MWIETQWEKKWSLFIHPSITSIHPSIHPHPPYPSTSIHLFIHIHHIHPHPSIHPLFFTLANFLIMQIRDEEKDHKRNSSDTKSWQHFRAKERKQQQQQKKKGLGEEMEKLKIIEKTHHHHHLLLLLLHYHLLHVGTIGCRLNILLQKTQEVCSKRWFARKVESLSLSAVCFFKVQNFCKFWGFFFLVLFCFLVVCTIGPWAWKLLHLFLFLFFQVFAEWRWFYYFCWEQSFCFDIFELFWFSSE